ncbi:MAG: hypothetical protein FJW96_00395 [Actinobacteria bacterium]|nr:hypothetical protein [Actinomycetota bacterium]
MRTGDDQWSCLTGGRMLVGLCIRSTTPRGPLDFRGFVVFPDVDEGALPFSPVSFEKVLLPMVSFNAEHERQYVEARICGNAEVPSARWTVGTRSGIGWAYGVKGASLCSLARAELRRLAEWAVAPVPGGRLAGVNGVWECYGFESGTACYEDSLRIVAVPYLTHLSQAARDQLVRIALLRG